MYAGMKAYLVTHAVDTGCAGDIPFSLPRGRSRGQWDDGGPARQPAALNRHTHGWSQFAENCWYQFRDGGMDMYGVS
jgi:hypothetical protein